MIEISYNPRTINSLISMIYCSQDELDNQSHIADIVYFPFSNDNFTTFTRGFNKSNIFQFVYDYCTKKWTLIHMKKSWIKTEYKSVRGWNIDAKARSTSSIVLDDLLSSNNQILDEFDRIIDIIIETKMPLTDGDRSIISTGGTYHSPYDNIGIVIKQLTSMLNRSMFDPSNKYIGIVTIENEIELVNIIDPNGNNLPIIATSFQANYINFAKKSVLSTVPEHRLKPINYANYCDIIVQSKTGLIHINSQSEFDMIMYIARYGNDVRSCINLSQNMCTLNPLVKYVIFRINQCFKGLQLLNPKSDYTMIFNSIKDNDIEYYNLKMDGFKTSIMEIFANHCKSSDNDGTFLGAFIDTFKRELAIELSVVYHRLWHYPHERTALTNHYCNHPYIELIKMIEDRFTSKNDGIFNFVNSQHAYDILTVIPNQSSQEDYDLTKLIQNAITHRSELFNYAYDLYKKTTSDDIQPKVNTRNVYYPFKIFSPALYVMEHLLSVK